MIGGGYVAIRGQILPKLLRNGDLRKIFAVIFYTPIPKLCHEWIDCLNVPLYIRFRGRESTVEGAEDVIIIVTLQRICVKLILTRETGKLGCGMASPSDVKCIEVESVKSTELIIGREPSDTEIYIVGEELIHEECAFKGRIGVDGRKFQNC